MGVSFLSTVIWNYVNEISDRRMILEGVRLSSGIILSIYVNNSNDLRLFSN